VTASGGMDASGRLRDLACSRPRAGPFKPGVLSSLPRRGMRAGRIQVACCVQPKLRRGHIAHDSYRYSLLTPAQKLSGMARARCTDTLALRCLSTRDVEYRDRRRWAAIPSLSPFTGCTRPAADCKVPNPTTNAYQDIKFVDGRLVASGLFPGRTGAIDWLDYPSLRLIRRVTVGQTSRGVPTTSPIRPIPLP